MSVGTLITNRRNFLIRASAVTAAGATVAVPIVAAASSRERIGYHLAALKKAMADHYGPGFNVGDASDLASHANLGTGRAVAWALVCADRDPKAEFEVWKRIGLR